MIQLMKFLVVDRYIVLHMVNTQYSNPGSLDSPVKWVFITLSLLVFSLLASCFLPHRHPNLILFVGWMTWVSSALHVTLSFIPLLAAIGSYEAVNSSFHGVTLFVHR
ncbi:hypothetical protein MTR67_001928 [Solanum verrucosum]|uniref:Uncharacterized protein n=1 Tax=Solanum verrucosum TaxID=315347 RepID=A0AAF0T8W4_SOLVR|nr:hypothetical protein MTR67_001928 [Solanum verrucosum]